MMAEAKAFAADADFWNRVLKELDAMFNGKYESGEPFDYSRVKIEIGE